MVGLLELGAGPLCHALRFLPPQDVLRASQVCKLLHDLAQDDRIWQQKARERFPADTVQLGGVYKSYKELFQDDNRQHASLLLLLPEMFCDYKFARSTFYYECRLLALTWNRSDNAFRLYFDARGEGDLRHPMESSIGFMVHRPRPHRAALRRKVRELQRRKQQLAAASVAARAQGDVHLQRRWDQGLLRLQTQEVAALQALHSRNDLSFADLLTVVRSSAHHLVVEREGHYMGYLEFDSLHKADSILEELPSSYVSKRQALEHGLDLVFCYANPIPVMPHGAMVDYHSEVLATIPPGALLVDSFAPGGYYAAHKMPLQKMREEGSEAQRQRWADAPTAVLERQPPWLADLALFPPAGEESGSGAAASAVPWETAPPPPGRLGGGGGAATTGAVEATVATLAL